MKKSILFNLMFGVMMSVFAITLFVLVPSGDMQAEQPAPKSGLTYKPATAPPAAEVGQDEPTAEPHAVEPTPPTTPSDIGTGDELVDKLLNQWTLVSAGIINLLVFLTGLFPKFVLFKDDRKRDLLAKTLAAVGVAVVAMVTMGPGNAWPVIIGFAVAVFNYNNILKPIVGSTKTVAAKK